MVTTLFKFVPKPQMRSARSCDNRVLAAALGGLIVLTACSSGGAGPTGGASGGNAALTAVHFGRLVDVYGYADDGATVELARTDVLIGADIEDERPPGSDRRDPDVRWDFLSANPDTLQPRVLIPRRTSSREFRELLDKIDDGVRRVAPGLFGQNTTQEPFTVVPRNAAIRLLFSGPLGVTDDFFVSRDGSGKVNGLKNTEAVQLLKIAGDPNDKDPRGDFEVITTRVVVRGAELILDPVLLGTEGLQYNVRNNASGMPASPDQIGANIRIAVALEGPLAIPGLTASNAPVYVGLNNSAVPSIVRDFRSGNVNDNSADIARGFVRDPEPPRIVGELLTFLEQVDEGNSGTQVIKIYKNNRDHEIDRGDVVRVVDRVTGDVLGRSEIVIDPSDDAGRPEVQHVRVIIRSIDGLERIDPRNDPNYPSDLRQREQWLRENAPRVVLVSEFTASRQRPNGTFYGDDPVNFLAFTPAPLPDLNGVPSDPNTNVSPSAGAVLRFTKPVDLATVRALDSFFFATRNVLDDEVIFDEFIQPRNIEPKSFSKDKFIIPHLVVSRVFDQDGSQTTLRLQPAMGFHLNEEMRPPHANDPSGRKFVPHPYYLHLLGGPDGVRDLSGNPIDFQGDPAAGIQDFLTIPFTLDTRSRSDGKPAFPDNLVVHIARRYETEDEDEQPSYYRPDEVTPAGSTTPKAEAYPLRDVFGAVVYLTDGRLLARPTTRITKIVDDLNQQAPPPQRVPNPANPNAMIPNELRFCADTVGGEEQIVSNSAAVRFGQGIQNPLNPFGARLQTVWREIDMSLSRVDPFDFNLDVEQMYWAPFTGAEISYDELDRASLFLGHSEFRPEPCVGSFSALPSFGSSGLASLFEQNYAYNLLPGTGTPDEPVAPHAAYIDQRVVIDPAAAYLEPNQTYRYLALPEFEKPYFVWRDETSKLQGAISGQGADVRNSNNNYDPYIISPFLGGQGRYVSQSGSTLQFNRNYWDNMVNYGIRETSRRETYTGGGTHAIALPLLADLWTYPDDPDLPAGNGFFASGLNGWQIALAVQSSPQPNFRAFSGGFSGAGGKQPVFVDPSTQAWDRASGGYTLTGSRTNWGDNSVYWVMADFLKRQTVVTAGFVDILNPHRMPDRKFGEGDPRLGPYFVDANGASAMPLNVLPYFDWAFEPPLENLPAGTAVIPQFRAAGEVDPEPWRHAVWFNRPWWGGGKPDAVNFPLDPLKAGDAQVRKYDDRFISGTSTPRGHWTYFYNKQISDYTGDINELVDGSFLSRFAGANETFVPRDVRYFNWRFIMRTNPDANPPVSPAIESFSVVYRFENQ